jgi:phenylalanyl-tRNA synthetase beta chain
MRVPLSWLREFVDFDLTPEALAERLTLLGMEVQAIERIGTEWSSVVVGELLDVAPHPNAGRLSLTRVRVGDGEPELSIVCGATNIAVGQRVPVALPGAVLPGGRRIEVTRIAGEPSHGMLCSGAELGVTPDAEGILILDGGARVGVPLRDLLGDEVLDVDVKPNRGDALSILGLAREVAAALQTTVRVPPIDVTESGDATDAHVSVEVRDPIRCPRFVARYLDGITVGPSPVDVQVRLTAAGIRPISNVVDASNYVMVELGKPTHAFDAGRVAEGRIIVRAADPGERLETLDHVQRELTADTLIIADPTGPLGIAGVMGGASSEVGDATTSVILESAVFDPVTIRRMAQHYNLRSEASVRFEKGQEWRLARVGADRAAQLIQRWAGGRAAVGAVDTDRIEQPPARLPFRPARISRILGIDIEPDEMRALLARVGIATEAARPDDGVPIVAGERPLPLDGNSAQALVASIPSHRRDLVIEADIAEEVARVRGYETVPGHRPDTLSPPYRPDPAAGVDMVRQLLTGRGLNEVVTYSLVAPLDHARLGFGPDDPDTVRAANPVTVDHSELRRSLIPELTRVLVDNERQRRDDVAIFEVGIVHSYLEGVPSERRLLGLLLSGPVTPPYPGAPQRNADVADAKGLLEWLVSRVGSGHLRYEPTAVMDGVEHPGRTAAVVAELDSGMRLELGRVGELDPRYMAEVGARAEHVVVATLDLEGLARLRPTERQVAAPDRLPAIDRDISVVLARSRPSGEVDAIIRAAGGSHLRSVRLFDVYQGPPLGDEEVGLGYRLRFQPTDRPIEEADLDATIARITDALSARLGARLRT